MDNLPIDRVLQGDCLEVLETLPAESVDLIFADPPYNLQLHQTLWRPTGTRVAAVTDHWDQFESFEAYDAFTLRWLAACRRVLKKRGTLWVIGAYHNIYRVGRVLQDLGFWILNEVVWIKSNPMPNFRGVRFTNAHENLIWAQKERGQPYTFNHHAMKALNGQLQMRSDWFLPICSGAERIKVEGEKAHSTQKPEALLYRVILSSSNPGDLVLDPFFGTGTTGAVAKRLKRHWLGIEREAHYVTLAEERMAGIAPGAIDERFLRSPNPRQRRRIPFGALLENGLLHPGQPLFFEAGKTDIAYVLADGAIEYNGRRGSIHQVARQIRQAPCNGWELWYYEDPNTGDHHPIDRLRQIVRETNGAGE